MEREILVERLLVKENRGLSLDCGSSVGREKRARCISENEPIVSIVLGDHSNERRKKVMRFNMLWFLCP